MFSYNQSIGKLVGADGKFWGFGFAGNGLGLNNPIMESKKMLGPIPVGKYKMSAWFDNHAGVGMCAIELTPEFTDKYGRSGFFIHGSVNLTTAGLNAFLHSSDGCIVIGDCTLRRAIWASGDHELEVVA